ncbi:MAG: phytase [Acidobacteriota bacterium]|nr:MAG: phytase [Acidobacteriota bacterium]
MTHTYRTSGKDDSGRSEIKWLMMFFVLALATALGSQTASAGMIQTGGNDARISTDDQKNKEEKEEKEKNKSKKKKSKSEDDDEKEAEDEPKPEKKKKEKSDKKEKKQKNSSDEGNRPPSVSLSIEAIEAVNATIETDPVPNSGDAADDPAIWINKADPEKSTIIGTDKQGGLAVYDLSGKQLQYVADGELDNVDLRDDFKLGGQVVSLVTAGNRSDNSIVIYKVNPETRLIENVAARKITHGIKVYGSCMYRSAKTGETFHFATSKSGDVEQWQLFDNGSGRVDAKKVRSFKVGQVVEGCVADDELGHFYVSEEPVGIWKYGADPDAGDARTQVAKVGDGHLHADVEGLAIAYGKDGTGYLIASSQGNHSFVVYRREGNNEFVKKFRVAAGDKVDGAEETDGIDVTTTGLGPAFPQGVFVVQDGFNDRGNQNFKLVPFEVIFKP